PHIEFVFNSGARVIDEIPSQFAVRHDFPYCSSQRACVSWRNKQAVFARADDFGWATAIRRYNRNAASHRLEEHETERFLPGRDNQNIDQLEKIVRCLKAQEFYAKVRGLFLQLRDVLGGTHPRDEHHEPRSKSAHGGDRFFVTLMCGDLAKH